MPNSEFIGVAEKSLNNAAGSRRKRERGGESYCYVMRDVLVSFSTSPTGVFLPRPRSSILQKLLNTMSQRKKPLKHELMR